MIASWPDQRLEENRWSLLFWQNIVCLTVNTFYILEISEWCFDLSKEEFWERKWRPEAVLWQQCVCLLPPRGSYTRWWTCCRSEQIHNNVTVNGFWHLPTRCEQTNERGRCERHGRVNPTSLWPFVLAKSSIFFSLNTRWHLGSSFIPRNHKESMTTVCKVRKQTLGFMLIVTKVPDFRLWSVIMVLSISEYVCLQFDDFKPNITDNVDFKNRT